MKNKLNNIFNALQTISTKGKDTLVMADCLRALADIINSEEEEVCHTQE